MENTRTYRVVERLGEGAFGAVYLAESVGGGISRSVAIKVPHGDRAGNPELVSRLRDEARMLAMVRHRAIVRLDDLVELDGVWSIVMEFVDGADVATLLADGPIPVRPALAIAEEIANALHVAWNQTGPEGRPLHLLHRDIKPSNIRVTPSGEVKLLDFGVARAEFDAREAEATQNVFGTPTYLSPERFHGQDSPAGDVYALGVTLFEMLTGVPPGKSAMDADRQPPGRRWAEQWTWLGTVSPPLRALVARLLATDPEARPSARDAARLLGELRAVIGGETPEDWAERVISDRASRSATPPASGSLRIERSSSASTSRRGPSWWLAGGAAVLLIVVVGAAIAAAGTALYATDAPSEAPAAAAPNVPPPPAAPSVAAAPNVPPPPAAPSVAAAPDVPPPAEPVSTEPAPSITAAPVAAAEPAPAPAPKAAPKAAPTQPAAVTTPRPAPAAAPVTPKPNPEKPPATAPVAAAVPKGSGTLTMSGDVASYALSGPAPRAGVVPVGTYSAEVTLTSGTVIQVGGIAVREGETTSVKCSATFGRCQVK